MAMEPKLPAYIRKLPRKGFKPSFPAPVPKTVFRNVDYGLANRGDRGDSDRSSWRSHRDL